jgi:hypothetical protein
METEVAEAIFKEDVTSLLDLISKGFVMNEVYKHPIGCVSLFSNIHLKSM